MADIFDTIAAEPKGDIFDQIASETPDQGDIFDRVASAKDDPFITEFKDKKPVEDTFKDDWSGFVANMQISGNRLLQGVTGARLNEVAKWQKYAENAKKAADVGDPASLAAYQQDRIEQFGYSGIERRPEKIKQDADLKARIWRDEAKKIPEFASYIAEKEKRIEELTPSLSPEMQKLNEAKGADFWKTFASNPVESLANVIASSAIVAAPALAAGAVGSLAGPAGTAAGAGAGSYWVETSQSMLDALKEAGVDLTKPDEVSAAFSDPDKMEKAREFAKSRGIPIAIFDAASAGIAGKFISPLLKEGATATTKEVLKATGKEFASQAIAGGLGEAVAQQTSGQEFSGKDIFLEAVGEVGSAITEGYSNVKARARIDEELTKVGTSEPPPVEVPPTATQTAQGTPILSPEEIAAVPSEANSGNAPEDIRGGLSLKNWIIKRVSEGATREQAQLEFSDHKNKVNEWLDSLPTGSRTISPEGKVYIKESDGTLRSQNGDIYSGSPFGFKVEPPLPAPSEPVPSVPTPTLEQTNATQEGIIEQGSQPEYTETPQGGLPTEPGSRNLPVESKTEETLTDEQAAVANEAAVALQPLLNRATEAARQRGAVDPELAASTAMTSLSNEVGRGEKTIEEATEDFVAAARNVAMNQLAKESTQKRGGGKVVSAEEEVVPESATTVGPRAEVMGKEAAQGIEDVISSMPENDQKVMRAFMAGVTNLNDIAEQEGLTIDQVKKAKARAQRQLAQFVRDIGIGERSAPGASNIRELRNARYLLGADTYLSLENEGNLTRDAWNQKMLAEYGDIFDQEQLDEAWVVSKMAAEQSKESKGRKPVPAIIDQLTGGQKGEGITALRNAQVDTEREKRGLPPLMSEVRRSQPSVWDAAMRKIDSDPYAKAELLTRLATDTRATVTDEEVMILLHAKVEAMNNYQEALDLLNRAEGESAKMIAQAQVAQTEAVLGNVEILARRVGSEQGRSLAARKLLVSRDFSIPEMTAELRAAKGGEQLTEKDVEFIDEASTAIRRTDSELEARISELEEALARKEAQDAIDEMGTPDDPVVASLAQRIVERLNKEADKARARIRARATGLVFNAAIDPTPLYDLAVIGASKIANGLTRKSKWRKSMVDEFGEGFDPYVDQVWDESNKMVDNVVDQVTPEKNREKVRKSVKKMTVEEVISYTEEKMAEKVKAGESLGDLRSYVQKMALALVRNGVNQLDPLVDTIHAVVEPMVKGTTKRQVMDLISGYGDSKNLDMEAAKVTLRDLKGQAQQLAKLEDIRNREPLKKTGVERRTPSDEERRLIKQVNEAKKKFGVVVTDPERQLKSALDAIKTRVTNDIKDITHQIETGEKPIEGTPAPTSDEIEALKDLRNRLKETLKALEPKDPATQVERAEKALEASIADYEAKIKRGDTSKKTKEKLSTPKLDALRAKRDALKAELELLRDADTDAKNTKTFDAIMARVAELQGKLSRGEVTPTTRAEKIEDELINDARERLAALQAQMRLARSATPEGQKAQLDSAIKAVERSIESFDQRLKSGNIAPTAKTPRPTSPLLERLKAERDAMSKLISDLRKGPRLSPEEISIKAYKARLSKQIAEMQDRMARNDYAKKKRVPLDISKDSEATRILTENLRWKKEFAKKKYDYEQETMATWKKILSRTGNVLNATKASVGSMDLSAFARQAGPAVASRPLTGLANLGRSLKGAFSKEYFDREMARIEARPNAKNNYYQIGKVFFADMDGPLARREEAYRSSYADKVPWIRASNRAYNLFLNRMRADMFDSIISTHPGTPTREELRDVGKQVNIATGRGELGEGAIAGGAEAASFVFWSPRLYASRIQLLMGTGLWNSQTSFGRKVAMKEYLRMGAFGFSILALGAALGADIEWDDPSSSDYLKLRFGDVRIDPWAGMQQWMVFAYRMATGQLTTAKGEEKDLKRPQGPYDPTYIGTAGNMLRSKLNPPLAAYLDYRQGKDMGGNEVNSLIETTDEFPFLAGAIPKALLPLPVFNDDIVPVAEEFGLGPAAATTILNVIGVGVQNYDR